MNRLHVRGIVHIAKTEEAFAFADAFFGERRGAMLFVESVVDLLDQLWNDFVDLEVLVGRFFGGTGNNQRGARFVDENGVDFVHDGELVAALDAVRQVILHVVAKIVEAEFVVRAVGDVSAVGRAALVVIEVVNNDADGEAETTIERTHPLRVTSSEVIVQGDDVNAGASEGIQNCGKRGDERFAFARFHFGDFAVVQNESADELNVEMTHVEEAAARFASEGESGNDGRLKRGL